MELLTWREFSLRRPGLAALGKRMLWGDGDGQVAWLATQGPSAPGIAPVCPMFAGTGLYVLITSGSPKMRDLSRGGGYALHAQLGERDLEFQIGGRARIVSDPRQRESAMAAIPFEHYGPGDCLYELRIGRALSVSWDDPGKPRRISWRAD